MHRENAALWKAKPLLTKLCGDHTWAPCDLMVGANDAELFDDDFVVPSCANGSATIDVARTDPPKPSSDANSDRRREALNGEPERGPDADAEKRRQPPNSDGDVAMADTNPDDAEPAEEDEADDSPKVNGAKSTSPESREKQKPPVDDSSVPKHHEDDAHVTENPSNGGDNHGIRRVSMNAQEIADQVTREDAEMVDKEADDGRGVESTGLLNAPASELSGGSAMSVTPDIDGEPPIHPLFLAPRRAHPDRDLGLPEQEADDVRRLLQLWVQKQEEVARGTQKLYEGLLRADRLRRTVWKWAKAEAHCGPNRDLSDGEDWYDKEEWGLVEDLKKGHDEEEEDQQQTHKKTRNRR